MELNFRIEINKIYFLNLPVDYRFNSKKMQGVLNKTAGTVGYILKNLEDSLAKLPAKGYLLILAIRDGSDGCERLGRDDRRGGSLVQRRHCRRQRNLAGAKGKRP